MWGVYIVLLKYATNSKYLGIPWTLVMTGLVSGILMVTVMTDIISGKTVNWSVQSTGLALSVLAGALWALGQAFVLNALSTPGMDVSRLVVVYNLNTLVAVGLGIVFLNEIPLAESRIQVIVGAVLMMVGALLVTRGT